MKKLSINEVRKRAFRKFLYDNDVLEEWYKNTRELSSKKMVKDILNDIESDAIFIAFTWIRSPEGRDFWDKLSNKWEDVLKEM